MLDLFSPGRSLAWDLAWQATAFLVLGGVTSLMLARRPARAHRALLLAMIAGLATPLLAQAVRHLGLGLLAPGAGATSAVTQALAPAAPAAFVPRSLEVGVQRPADRGIRAAKVVPSEPEAPRFARITPRQLGLGAWVVLALAASARLAAALVLGVQVAARAKPVDAPALLGAAAAACKRLGLKVQPEIFASARLRCPVIWCWGRRPKLIVPEAAVGDRAIDWVAVLSHELAHWVRRDHLAALVGEVFACVLPWHPLAWWAKGRMGQVAELACDDWVLASGHAAADYAEALLGLMPQGHAPLAPAAVSSRRGLAGRVRRILADVHREPRVGRRWTVLAVAAVSIVAATIALVQVRPAAVSAAEAAEPETKAAGANHPELAISGRILLPDGRPVAGTTVDWVTFFPSATTLSNLALPKQMHEGRDLDGRLRILGQMAAGADGRFRIATRENLEETLVTELIVQAPGAALLGRSLWKKDLGQEITLQLVPAVTIEGRLLTPAGTPASGVSVELADLSNGADDEMKFDGIRFDSRGPESQRPRTMTTDADGRFVLDGVVPKGMFAEFHFHHPDYADDQVTVSTASLLTNFFRIFDVRPVQPRFTYTLKPARPVEGVVTAEEDGQPIAKATVEVIPMRRPSGDALFTTTDAEGRYRVAGPQADMHFVSVYPPLGAAQIAAQSSYRGWPLGAKVLTMNFALSQGKRFHGTVVDAETHRPIAGASVVYQPKRGNPNRQRDQTFKNPVLTDVGGRFAITGLAGTGYLLVEEGSLDYIRGTLNGKETGTNHTLYPHGFATVDVADGAEPVAVEISLRKGKILKARALQPDGRPLPSVTAACPELNYRQLNSQNALRWFDGGLFKLPGAEPGRTYRVFFLQRELGLATVAKLTLDPKTDGPVEVKLQPTATIKGMTVNKDGTPALGVQIFLFIVLTEDGAPLRDQELFDEDKAAAYAVMTQDMSAMAASTTAEFVFTKLIPGVRYYVGTGRSGATAREVRAPMPGEVIDLGKIVLGDKR